MIKFELDSCLSFTANHVYVEYLDGGASPLEIEREVFVTITDDKIFICENDTEYKYENLKIVNFRAVKSIDFTNPQGDI